MVNYIQEKGCLDHPNKSFYVRIWAYELMLLIRCAVIKREYRCMSDKSTSKYVSLILRHKPEVIKARRRTVLQN